MDNLRTANAAANDMPKKLEDGPATERVQIVTTVDWVKRVDEWRRTQERIPNRSEAIRMLVERALEAEGDDGERR